MIKQYGRPYLISSLGQNAKATALTPLSRSAAKAGTSSAGQAYSERWLQELIAAHPDLLPFAEVGEPAFEDAVSISTELPVGGKFLDNLLVTPRGYLVLVECKLWRNPEARRAVVGQILDYATEMARWDYTALDAAVRRANPAPGCAKGAGLYERLVDTERLPEARFVDAVSRNLKRGRFLLLVVGDGIHEGVEAMAGFLQQHAGLHFTLGLAEMPVYRLPDGQYLVQPRALARTVMIERGVVMLRDDRIEVQAPHVDAGPAAPPHQSATLAKAAVTISEEEMFEQLEANEPGLVGRFQAFLAAGAPTGITADILPTQIRLMGGGDEGQRRLGLIDPKNASIWFDAVARRAKMAGRLEAALRYYRRLVDLLPNEKFRQEKLAPGTKYGVRSLPLSPLLHNPDRWIEAAGEFLKELEENGV